jgi:hypothetical protein
MPDCSKGQDECGMSEVGNLHSHMGVSHQIATYQRHDPMDFDMQIYKICLEVRRLSRRTASHTQELTSIPRCGERLWRYA